jgi:hypothetical protein
MADGVERWHNAELGCVSIDLLILKALTAMLSKNRKGIRK